MELVIHIDNKDVGLKSTALTPKLYRHWIGRDMIADMSKLRKAYRKAESLPKDATEEEIREAQLSAIDLEIFECAAWVMARQYDPTVQNNPDDWLDQFETFSIYEALPAMLTLWNVNQATTAEPKKK